MTSPARRHFQRVSAASASAEVGIGEQLRGDAYDLVRAQLGEHQRTLKSMQSIERRIEAKRAMLPEYDPWVQGVLEGGNGAQDDVLTTIMVWKLDAGELQGALDIADYVLKHSLTLPDRFKRDVPTLLTEQIADQALQALAAGKPADWEALTRLNVLVTGRDMPDEVRAKLLKAAGLEMARSCDDSDADTSVRWQRSAAALDFLRRALQLHEKVGVKKEIEALERFFKNNPQPPPAGVSGASAADA